MLMFPFMVGILISHILKFMILLRDITYEPDESTEDDSNKIFETEIYNFILIT